MIGNTLIQPAVEASLVPALAHVEVASALSDSSLAPQHEELEELVLRLVDRYRHSRDLAVTMRRPLLDLGVDVLSLVDIVMDIETQFHVELDPEEILSWISAADVVDTVSEALRTNA
jgi:acyl carrier protein